MRRIVAATLLGLVVPVTIAGATELMELTGPYLGQAPPGSIPRLLAQGVVSVRENFEHSAAVFSPDGDELFWCTDVDHYVEAPGARRQQLFYMEVVDGVWTEPTAAPFAADFLQAVSRPVFSPDGQRLYFETGSRPHTEGESDADIYVVERADGTWFEPEPLPP
jgi:hypothetical protein